MQIHVHIKKSLSKWHIFVKIKLACTYQYNIKGFMPGLNRVIHAGHGVINTYELVKLPIC